MSDNNKQFHPEWDISIQTQAYGTALEIIKAKVEELKQKYKEEIEVRKGRWQFLKDTVRSALLPYIVPINKELGYNPKTGLYDKFSELVNELKRIEIIATAKAVVVPEDKGIFWTNKVSELEQKIDMVLEQEEHIQTLEGHVSDCQEQSEEPIDLSRRCSRCGNELNIKPTVDPLCETCFELQCQEEQPDSKLTPEDKVDELLGDPGELYDENSKNIIDDCHNCGLRDSCKDAKYNDKCMRWELKEPCNHEYDFDYDCIICGKNLLDNIDRTYLTIEFDLHNTHKIVRKVFIEKILEGYETLKDILNMKNTDEKKLQVLRDTLISQQKATKKEV